MFLINKRNSVYREKVSSGSENLLALTLINDICYSFTHKTRTK